MASNLSSTEHTGTKRKRNSEEEVLPNQGSGKQIIQEGMSWWTCFMLGIPHEQSKPHGVKVDNKDSCNSQQGKVVFNQN